MLVVLVAAAVFGSAQAQLDGDVESLPMNVTVTLNDSLFKINSAKEYLQVYALPVGQGDCTIIQCPTPSSEIAVVDCGSSGGTRLGYNAVANFLGNQKNNVAIIFITHPDNDHFSYLDKIWSQEDNNIKYVVIGGVLKEYAIKQWLSTFKKRLLVINGGDSCINCIEVELCDKNSGINLNILAANVASNEDRKDHNGNSIVIKVEDTRTQWSMLLPGDIEGMAATKIAEKLKEELQSHVYKMAHHGASTSANRKTWLKYIKPKQAFASSAYDYGSCCHPRCHTIDLLKELNSLEDAEEHNLYCGDGPKKPCHRQCTKHIYETSPNKNKICLLKYYSNGGSDQQCESLASQSLDIPNSSGGDDECNEEPEEELLYEKNKAPQDEEKQHCQASSDSDCQTFD